MAKSPQTSISACVARADMDVCGDFAIGHYTHEKNPVTARAALTTLQIIEDEGLVARSARLGAWAQEMLHDRLERHPKVGDIRGRGLMFGVEMVEDRATRAPASGLAERVYYRALENGVSFKISAGSTLTLSPPLTIEESDLEQALNVVMSAIEDICPER